MAAVLAHEIKTPLTSIKMNADILDEILDLKAAEKTSFSIIQKEINRLNNLVKDVLNFSRQTDLVYSTFDLQKMIENITIQVKNKLVQKNVKLISEVPSIQIEADEEKLTQVFLNLIDNSLDNFKVDGVINISSRFPQNGKKISISVEDNGGSNLDPKKIFEPFFTSKASGTGLGLSISQKIINQHQGNIILQESNREKTVFRIDLPLKRS